MPVIRHLEKLAPGVKLYVIEVPDVAVKARAGQFVILRVHETGERFPLTIADYDAEEGTITLVVQEVGRATQQMGKLLARDEILNLAGPLGRPSEIEKFGTVYCLGGGIGIAPIYPIARALKEEGNTVVSILGARNKELLFWEDKLRSVSDEVIVTTDDGSYGLQGFVTHPLKEHIDAGRRIDRVIAIGPVIMMQAVVQTTREGAIPTIVSLNPIMIDGTGMCGGCRVTVGDHTRFVCVDGPEFDGHEVDFRELMARQRQYDVEEEMILRMGEQERP